MNIVDGSAIEINVHAEAALKQFYKEYIEELTEYIQRYDLQNDRRLLIAFIHDTANAKRLSEALEKAYRCGVAHEKYKKSRERRCAYCGDRAEGKYNIHRDGFCQGPEVPLCNGCGGAEKPTEREIWSRIGQAKNCIRCEEPIKLNEKRFGSYHARCF